MEENKQETALAVAENSRREFSMDLASNESQAFTSLKNETVQEKAILYKAMSNPDTRLGDCINQVIRVKDVFMEKVEMVNKETGELSECPRIVLVDENGKSYQAVSFGVFNALKRIFQVFGNPTWEEPISLKVIQVTKGEKKMLSLDVQF